MAVKIKKRETIIVLLLLALSLLSAHRGLKGELAFLRSSPALMELKRYDKKLLVDGQIYALGQRADVLIAETARVLFIDLGKGDRAYRLSKMKYYLAPRSFESYSTLNKSSYKKSPATYAVVLSDRRSEAEIIKRLNPGWEIKAFLSLNRGFYAIYKIAKLQGERGS